MKTLTVLFSLLTLVSCSVAYDLAQQADNQQCMDRSNNEDKLNCRLDDESYSDYKRQREALLNEDE